MADNKTASGTAMYMFAEAEQRRGCWRRRALSIPLYFLLWIVFSIIGSLSLAVFIPLELIFSRTKNIPHSRAILFFLLYLNAEIAGLFLAFLIWLLSGVWLGLNKKIFIEWNYILQRLWADVLFKGALRIFSMKLEEGEESLIGPAPFLLFMRHASTADTILPAALVANRQKIYLRYVLKRELLWDICLDAVGNRIPNVFVIRRSSEPEKEISAVRKLAENLGPKDAVIIFPEGTRFSSEKLERRKDSYKESAYKAIREKVGNFKNVLPPKLGGPLALMEVAADLPVVIGIHTGFEGAINFKEFWSGGLIGKTVKICFKRYEADDIPTDSESRAEWLFERWLEVDRWVEHNKYDEGYDNS